MVNATRNVTKIFVSVAIGLLTTTSSSGSIISPLESNARLDRGMFPRVASSSIDVASLSVRSDVDFATSLDGQPFVSSPSITGQNRTTNAGVLSSRRLPIPTVEKGFYAFTLGFFHVERSFASNDQIGNELASVVTAPHLGLPSAPSPSFFLRPGNSSAEQQSEELEGVEQTVTTNPEPGGLAIWATILLLSLSRRRSR